MADIAFQVPNAPGTELVIRPGFWGTKVLKDGQPLRRAGGRGSPYLLSLPDGSEHRVQVAGFLNLSVKVDDHAYPIERRLRPIEYLLAGIPLILMVPGIAGGVVGVGLGMAGLFINARLARGAGLSPMRVLAMLGVSAGLIGIYFAAAVALSLLIQPLVRPSFAVGECFRGPTSPPAAVDAYSTVSCASDHDAEVVGTPADEAATSGYPGEPALDAFANSACAQAFEAYVGQPFEAAPEGMVYFLPTADGWTHGDRTVVCLAVAPPGQRLTGSLRH